MRVSTATTTNKRVFSLNKIKGVDLSSAPLRVKETRASFMRNMICKDGANHKRNGFYDVASFFDSTSGEPLPINGIYPYQKDGVKYKVVHAGSNLYRCSEDFSDKKPITIPAGISLGAEKSQGFVDDGKLYIIANGRLLVLDELKLYSLFNNERAYVPTTSIAITDTEHLSLLEPFEGANLFCAKRINKLNGRRNGESIKIDDFIVKRVRGSQAIFYLDGEIDFSKKISIEARTHINGPYAMASENELNLVAYYDKTHYKVNGDIITTFDIIEESIEVSGTSIMDDADKTEILKFEESIPDEDETTIESFKVKATNENGRGKLVFTPALPSYLLGEDNIVVEYHTVKEEPQIKLSQVFSAATVGNMLILATNDDMVYYSHPSYGFNYVPDNNYLKITDAHETTALAPGNNFLGVCTSDKCAIVGFDIATEDNKVVVVPSLLTQHNETGCFSNNLPACIESDALIVNKKGVFGIGTNDVYMRSSSINKELASYSREKLEKAVGLECDGRYYLFVDGKVYVADARYKSYESNRLDVSFEYEWWVWDNCPCRVAIKENEQILIGREDGYIVTQGEGYVDTTSYELGEGEILLDGLNSFTFNDELNINENDELRITGAYEILTMTAVNNTQFIELDSYNTEVVLPASAYVFNDYLGRKIEIVCVNWYTLEPTGHYSAVITEILPEEHAIIINHQSIYIPTQEKERILYCIDTVAHQVAYSPVKANDGTYRLESERGGAYFYQYDESIGAILTRKKPVECELHSAVVSLGSDVLNKTIHKLVFVPSIETKGKIKIGYETINSNQVKPQLVSSALDFNKIDFNEFSFDASFYKRYEKRVHERKVELVKFKFLSADDGDFCIEQFSCIYSINGR